MKNLDDMTPSLLAEHIAKYLKERFGDKAPAMGDAISLAIEGLKK